MAGLRKLMNSKLLLLPLVGLLALAVLGMHGSRIRRSLFQRVEVTMIEDALLDTADASTPVAPVEVEMDETIAFVEPAVYPYEADKERDPLVPLTSKDVARGTHVPAGADEMPALTVDGIIWEPNEQLALVNGQIVRAGDTVAGAKVKTVHRDRVVLEFQGNEVVLYTKP